VGVNPGLRSAEVGHNFARPGNRFWPALHRAGITPRLLRPDEEGELPSLGVGITNFVARPSAAADELSAEELRAGAVELERLVGEWRPGAVAILGVTAYRTAFARPKAAVGPQPEPLAGRPVWLLPNPSGRTAAYQLPRLAELFREAWQAADDQSIDRNDVKIAE
jgi:TDG/mug DNA glycosylase family protein